MSSNLNYPFQSSSPSLMKDAERTFLQQVFLWMFGALGVTTVVAVYLAAATDITAYFMENRTLFYVLLLSPLVFVIALSWAMDKISSTTATVLFFVYAALNGVTFAVLLEVYTSASIVGAFAGAAGLFGGMAAYGFLTKRDLSGMGGILFGAVCGLIVASIAYIFIGGETLNLIIGWVGVVVFSLLTAYDMQKIKEMASGNLGSQEQARKMAIFGALSLYLDFINLVISLLRIFGSPRD